MQGGDKIRDLSVILQVTPVWRIIRMLMKYGKLPVKQLAAECQISVAEALEVMRQMEAKGLVELTIENRHQYASLKNVYK